MRKLILILVLANLAAQAQVRWPKGKKALIVLTYDDALLSQLNVAAPQLKAAGFKATFFLTSDINSQTIPRWRKLAKKGNELANHTVFHPCMPGNDNPVSSAPYTAYRMIREIEVMNHFLNAVDGKDGRTFAYPCTETVVGNQDYVDSLKLYKMVKYARIGGDSEAVISDFDNLDFMRIPSYGLDGNNADQLIDFVKKVEASGGMGIFMFHGIGGDYLSVSGETHQALLSYLKKNKKTIWVTTFQQAMDYVIKNNVHKGPILASVGKPAAKRVANVSNR